MCTPLWLRELIINRRRCFRFYKKYCIWCRERCIACRKAEPQGLWNEVCFKCWMHVVLFLEKCLHYLKNHKLCGKVVLWNMTFSIVLTVYICIPSRWHVHVDSFTGSSLPWVARAGRTYVTQGMPRTCWGDGPSLLCCGNAYDTNVSEAGDSLEPEVGIV